MSSPSDTKNQEGVKQEDQSSKTTTSPRTENKQSDPVIKQQDESKAAVDGAKETTASTTNAPLAPPPVPNKTAGGDNDYFSGPHSAAHLSKEPNPFENAFGAPSETPGKPQLPGVTSLTSPAPLLPGHTPAWPGSLRSGPLSPAMLTGPTGSSNDYFSNDHHFGGSFPTPNESSLRTGLTPGGGGSMFPQPSPNSQAIFNAIQSGGATPGTLDFHRTAMHARAANGGNNNFPMGQPPTSAAADPNIQPNLDSKGFGQQQQNDSFEQHDANDAANGLFMLAQARNRGQQAQYPPPQQQPQMNYMGNPPHLPGGLAQQGGHDNSNNMPGRNNNKNSIASNLSGSTQNERGEYSDSANSEDVKPTRGKGKKGGNAKSTTNGRRKAEDTPKGPNKRQKSVHSGDMDSDMDDMDDDMDKGPDTRKMTDEEKRKNFLERNRIAALKCRQRKKQWLANLQQKVEIFSTENDALAATVTQLREEIVGLKTLLLAHKDCPVSQAQGISGMAMQNIAGEPHQFGNPYGMMSQGMQQSMASQANMQRR